VDPNVITAAAKSPLGILALIVLALSGIATAYFRESPVKVRVSMFVLMLLAAGLFAATVLKQPPGPAPTPPVQPSQAGGNAPAATTSAPEPPPSAPTTPASQAGPSGAGQLLPDSSDRLLQPDEIAGLSAAELRIARNEIYARHGYIFQSPDLSAHFSQFAWYKPTRTAGQLNPVEQQNIGLIKGEEAAR
jgi:hypothetical protein